MFSLSLVRTSLSGLVAHSRDSRGDLDMMVALVCMMGFNDHTCGRGGGGLRFYYSFQLVMHRKYNMHVFFLLNVHTTPKDK